MEEKALINFDDKKVIETLKQTVAQNATDAEFAMFSQFCKSTGLNPFKKEIWFIKAGGRVQMMTGINGFWAIANSHPQFDGYEEDIELDEKGNIVKAWCKIYRKDRRYPSMGVAIFKEVRGSSPVWSSRPSQMVLKCAESFALRKAFPQELNGLYTQEEMPAEYAAPQEKAEVLPAPKPLDLTGMCLYRIPPNEVTDKTHKFFAKRGGGFDAAQDLWYAPRPVEKDAPPMAEYRQLRNAMPSTEVEEDDLPDWHQESNAKVPEEKPLEKAKRRAKEIEAKSQGALEVDAIVERMNIGE